MHKVVIYSKSESRERRGSVPGTSPTQPLTSSSQAPGIGDWPQGHMGGPQRCRCNANSDGEGDEAVVTLDVSLQDLRAGAQDTLKTRPVQLDALEGTPGHDSGCTGPVQ